MGRLIAAAVVAAFAALAQAPKDEPFQEAGVCARCHVISVVEWGMSAHRGVGTGCTACHGASIGHVRDERNNVKPDRVPRGAAVAALCADCHKSGCPKSRQTASCQSCHHYHALVDPSKPATASSSDVDIAAERQRQEYGRLMERAEKFAKAEQWRQAHAAFQAALRVQPGDAKAAERLKMCERRLKPDLRDFEVVGSEFDPASGLALRVKVAGLDIPMVLVPGGEFEMGSEKFAASRPVHTVRVPPFYLGQFEVTQAQWRSLMGSNPSARQGAGFPDADRMPVEQVSWDDAQVFLKKLNERVAGGGFRLPTEAEWEFAARSGGAEPEPGMPGRDAPRPVDQGRPDRLGLQGILGNVWEWCSSLSRPYPFDAGDGREAADQSGLRILRGGAFADPPDLLDPALRHAERPDRRLRWNGLRLAREVPESR